MSHLFANSFFARTRSQKRMVPSVAKMINLLIGERAKFIALHDDVKHIATGGAGIVSDEDRDQARREIEAEVLR